MGSGGGSSVPQFKAQGSPPNFDYQSAMGLQQLAIGGDIQGYSLSNQAFANMYPALQNAYNNWQSSIGTQVGLQNQGAGLESGAMGGLANQIAGRFGKPTTQNIQNIQQAGATAGGAVQPLYNLGGAQTALGTSQAGFAQPIANTGANIGALGSQLAGSAQIPYQMGQQLLQEPIDPQTQQQMMLAGLGSAAGALGGASLGQGMAGQSAAARQLGLNTLQYGQAMRGEAMGDINQYASMLGQGGQLQGLGAQTMGLGSQQLGQAAQTYGLGGQSYGMGVNAASTAGGLYGQAQSAQEQYGMDTAQMASMLGQMQQGQTSGLIGQIANAGQLFTKLPFGLGGTNLAQAELAQSGAYNSFQQANYATMNGIAWNNAQLQAQQNAMNQQASASMTSGLLGAGTAAATTGATIAAMTCFVARAVYPGSKRWMIFRHWLMHKAPKHLRGAYLKHGQTFALKVERNFLLRSCLRVLMDQVIERTVYVYQS